jgi:hypothetical protein
MTTHQASLGHLTPDGAGDAPGPGSPRMHAGGPDMPGRNCRNPGGMPASSRWSSAATPPDHRTTGPPAPTKPLSSRRDASVAPPAPGGRRRFVDSRRTPLRLQAPGRRMTAALPGRRRAPSRDAHPGIDRPSSRSGASPPPSGAATTGRSTHPHPHPHPHPHAATGREWRKQARKPGRGADDTVPVVEPAHFLLLAGIIHDSDSRSSFPLRPHRRRSGH